MRFLWAELPVGPPVLISSAGRIGYAELPSEQSNNIIESEELRIIVNTVG